MFIPCLNFYETWNNKIQQFNDKSNFLSSTEAFRGGKKQIEWYKNNILLHKVFI